MNLQTPRTEAPSVSVLREFTRKSISSRLPFAQSSLASVPIQLLPGVVYSPAELEKGLRWQYDFSTALPSHPRFAVLFSVEGDLEALARLSESLALQSYQHFVLLVSLHGTKTPVAEVYQLIEKYSLNGKVFASTVPTGSLSNLKGVLDETDADYFIRCESDDFFHPSAFYILAKSVLRVQPTALFTNELELSSDLSSALSFYRKSPIDKYTMLSMNCLGGTAVAYSVTHLTAMLESDEASDEFEPDTLPWYLAARFISRGGAIEFVPLACVVRAARERQASSLPVSAEVHDSVFRVVSLQAQLLDVPLEQVTEIKRSPQVNARAKIFDPGGTVQVVIPFRDQSETTIQCLRKLLRQDCLSDLEITLVNNNSRPETLREIESFLAKHLELRSRVVHDTGYFNFARLNNFGARHGETDFILFLNNDVELQEKSSIRELRRWCSLSDIGAVGGALFYPNGKLQHGGIAFSAVRPRNIGSANEFVELIREVNGVTFAMALVKREAFHSVGGLDEFACPNGFGDAIFCAALKRAGFRTLFTPYAVGTHHESLSRGRTPEDMELLEMTQNGVPVANLYEDLNAELQRVRLDLCQPNLSPVHLLGRKLIQSPRAARALTFVARNILRLSALKSKWGKKRQMKRTTAR